VTARRRLGPIAFRAFGQYHRDARIFLVTTLVAGAAMSLYWIDFNLYLASLGLSPATIGLVSTISSAAGALIAFPASAASDRVGRRLIIGVGMAVSLLALFGLIASAAVPVIVVSACLFAAGSQGMQVVIAPYRNELFAMQFAIQSFTNIIAAVLGGVVAGLIALSLGMDPAGSGTYRIILVIMAVLTAAGLATVTLLSDDRPRTLLRQQLRRLGEPAAFPRDPRRSRALLGITIRDRALFFKLLFPGLLISIGAGQVIPFLNIYVQGKFGLNLASLNAVFALTSLGTLAAILFQPRLARRFGQITSVVLVQGISIPFLVVLGFSPVLWMVIAAMAVRNSLMNAGNPIFTAFAMERVSPGERASLSAAMSVLWQIGWIIGGLWYSSLQASLGFEVGYNVNFVTIITLYSIATLLYWKWFRETDRKVLESRATA
jgi:MFS family permease